MADVRRGKRVRNARRILAERETDLQRLFDTFYRDKVAEGRSPQTLMQYGDGWRAFQEYLNTLPAGEVAGFAEVTPDVIREYAHWLLTEKRHFSGNPKKKDTEKGLQPSSVNTRLKTLRVMFAHLLDNSIIDRNPIEKVKNVVEREKPIDVLTAEQLQALLAAPDQKTYAGFRDHALITLLIDGFLRINEALTVREQDVDFGTGVLSVRG